MVIISGCLSNILIRLICITAKEKYLSGFFVLIDSGWKEKSQAEKNFSKKVRMLKVH